MTELGTDTAGGPMGLLPNTHELLVRMANDYSAYFKVDIYPSISKLQEFLEEAAAKLDELSSLFEMNEAETNDWLELTVPEIIATSVRATTDVRTRIDTFQELMEKLKVILDKQEAQIVQAEHSFGSSSSSLRSVLNYFVPQRRLEPMDSLPKVPFEPQTINVDSYFAS